MPDYSIYVLGESQLTISGGGQLDGVTQGDGSHLLGKTITLNSGIWQEVFVSDNDPNFQDSDSSQKLDGPQTIDGVSYANNSVVEAEYGLTLSDGFNTYVVVGFNVNNSNPAYATVEGLAFIGGPGGFPPVGVPLTVVGTFEGPNYPVTSYATPICYDRDTLIDTPRGLRRVDDLRSGDLVNTMDHGPQSVRWVGGREVPGIGRFAPVLIPAGILGARSPLRVSQQHRMMVSGSRAELLFGEAEVFVPAVHLVSAGMARFEPVRAVSYFHIALDHHHVIWANGAASESYFAGDATQREGTVFFPELGHINVGRGPLARRALRRHEAALLLANSTRFETSGASLHSVLRVHPGNAQRFSA